MIIMGLNKYKYEKSNIFHVNSFFLVFYVGFFIFSDHVYGLFMSLVYLIACLPRAIEIYIFLIYIIPWVDSLEHLRNSYEFPMFKFDHRYGIHTVSLCKKGVLTAVQFASKKV